MLKHLFKYYFRAQTRYRIHSPFVYELIQEVIEDDRQYYIYDVLQQLRGRLSNSAEEIEVLDLGAGARKGGSNRRKVADIVKHSVSPDWQCQFLFRLVNYLQPQHRLEIGSSLGLSTLYQYFAHPSAPLVTLEGSPEIARMAKENFKMLDAPCIELMDGDFEKTLPIALQKLGKLDFAFIDGNHRKEPTLQYFEQCLPYLHKTSVLVFDDIYWSDEMAEAWTALKAQPAVTLSIDLFWCGLLFFREEQKEKQHFTLIPQKYKPWQLGLFR